jgi:hypothetical protein
MPYTVTTDKDGKTQVVVTGFDPTKAKNPEPAPGPIQSLVKAGARVLPGEIQNLVKTVPSMLPGGDVNVGALGLKGATAGLQELVRTGDVGKASAASQQSIARDISTKASPVTRMMAKGTRDLTQSVLGNLPADEFARTGWAPPRKPGAPDAPILGIMPALPKIQTKGQAEDIGAGLLQGAMAWFLAGKVLGGARGAAMRVPGVAGATGAVSRTAAMASQEARAAAALAPKPVGAAINVAAKAGKVAGKLVLEGAPTGAIVDYAAFDPSESGRISDAATKWIDTLPDPIRNAAHALVLSAPGDTAADARWKNAVEGFMVLGPAVSTTLYGLGKAARAVVHLHKARVAGRAPEPPTGGIPAAAQTVDVTAGTLGGPVAQAPQGSRTLPAEAYYPRLNYSDINPSASPTLNASGKRYAKALAGQDQAAVEATQQAIQSSFKDAAAKLGIEPGPNAGSQSWSIWDIGKQLYMSANPTKSSKAYALGNPLVDVQVQTDIVDRMLGFELTQGVDPQGKRLPSWRLTEIGRKARKGAGVELSLQPAQGTLAPPASTIQQAEASLRTAVDDVDTAIAKAAGTVPDEMKGPRLPLEQAAPAPSVPSAGTPAPAGVKLDPNVNPERAARQFGSLNNGKGKWGITEQQWLDAFKRLGGVPDWFDLVGGKANWEKLMQGQDMPELEGRIKALAQGEPPPAPGTQLTSEQAAGLDPAAMRKAGEILPDQLPDSYRVDPDVAAAVKEAMVNRVRRIAGDDVAVRFQDNMVFKEGSAAHGTQGKVRRIGGGYNLDFKSSIEGDPIKEVIDFHEMSLLPFKGATVVDYTKRKLNVAAHEAFHVLQLRSMTADQLKVMDTMFAKLKLYFAEKNRLGRASGRTDKPIETGAQAFESYADAAAAGVSPGAVMLGITPDDIKFFNKIKPTDLVEKTVAGAGKAILDGIALIDDMFTYAERLWNAFQRRGWTSVRDIFAQAYAGELQKQTGGLGNVLDVVGVAEGQEKEWARRIRELDKQGVPSLKPLNEFAKGEGLLAQQPLQLTSEAPQGPRPVDPPAGPENNDDWVRNFARALDENHDALIRGEVTMEDLMANNFQKVQSPSGDTRYAVVSEDLVSGYNAMSKALPDRPTESGQPVMNIAETQALVQQWFYRHGADQQLVDNSLMPVIRALNEYQAGDLNKAMALADKKQVEASMEAAMWLNSANVDDVNQSERLARLVTAAEAARASHQTVMGVQRRWGQMGLEMQMPRDYVIPPATRAGEAIAAAPAPEPLPAVIPPEIQGLDVGETIRVGLEDEATRPITDTLGDDLREAATGGEITPKAQAEADAIAQTLVDAGADPTIRTKVWGNVEWLRDKGQGFGSDAFQALQMLRVNNLISSGVTANVNFQNGLLNLIRLPLTQVAGSLSKGELKRSMYSMMMFQQYWMNLSNAFRLAGHALKAGQSLMNMDVNTLDFINRLAAKDAQGELLQGPDAKTGWTINTVNMGQEMAKTPLGMTINGLWQVLGTGASRLALGIDTFNSTLAGYSYEHVRHLPRGMEQAVERGMDEFSPEAWKFAQQYADARTQATMRDAVIDGKNLADVAMESPHAKNFMNAINFTDDVWAEMQPRTLAEGIQVGQSQGINANELQDFARKYVEEGQLNHRLANFALNSFGRLGSLPGATMNALSEARLIGPVFKFIQPFQRVPSNIIKSAMRGTPAAVFVDTWWRDINSADAFTRDRALGEVAVGSSALALLTLSTTMGYLRFNGGGPQDPADRRKWTDIEGRMPYSVQHWDEAAGRWSAATSMQALEPFATLFGAIGDYTDLANNVSSDQRNRLGDALVMTLVRMTTSGVLSKTYFQGINEIYEAAFNPSKILVGPGQRDPLARFLERIAASMVPYSSALRAARREVDPVARTVDPSDAGGLWGFWQETLDEIRNAVPGYSQDLPARRDFINGLPILTPGILGGEIIPADMPWLQGAMQVSPLSAYRQVRQSLGPVHEEMARLSGRGTNFMGPSATDFGPDARLIPSELEAYVETFATVKDPYGRTFEQTVTQLIQSPQYQSWPLDAPNPRDVSLRAAAIQAEIQAYKKLAKEQYKVSTIKGKAIAIEEAATEGRKQEANAIRQYGMGNSPQPAQAGAPWSPTPVNR